MDLVQLHVTYIVFLRLSLNWLSFPIPSVFSNLPVYEHGYCTDFHLAPNLTEYGSGCTDDCFFADSSDSRDIVATDASKMTSLTAVAGFSAIGTFGYSIP